MIAAVRNLFYGWKIIGTSIVGYSAAPGQFAVGILGIFVIPLQLEFGWSRTEIFLSITILTLAQAFFTPFLGRLIDNYGSKKIMMPSIFTFGLLLAGIPLFVGELTDLYLFYAVIGVNSIKFKILQKVTNHLAQFFNWMIWIILHCVMCPLFQVKSYFNI